MSKRPASNRIPPQKKLYTTARITANNKSPIIVLAVGKTFVPNAPSMVIYQLLKVTTSNTMSEWLRKPFQKSRMITCKKLVSLLPTKMQWSRESKVFSESSSQSTTDTSEKNISFQSNFKPWELLSLWRKKSFSSSLTMSTATMWKPWLWFWSRSTKTTRNQTRWRKTWR